MKIVLIKDYKNKLSKGQAERKTVFHKCSQFFICVSKSSLCSQMLTKFNKFPQLFTNCYKLSYIFTCFHRFWQMFTSFHKFSHMFKNFHKCSQIFTNFHKWSHNLQIFTKFHNENNLRKIRREKYEAWEKRNSVSSTTAEHWKNVCYINWLKTSSRREQ